MGGGSASPGGDPAARTACDGCRRPTDLSATPGAIGRYCPDCAEMLALYRRSIACAECGVRIEDDDAADHAGWRYVSIGGSLTPFCAECTEQEFGL